MVSTILGWLLIVGGVVYFFGAFYASAMASRSVSTRETLSSAWFGIPGILLGIALLIWG